MSWRTLTLVPCACALLACGDGATEPAQPGSSGGTAGAPDDAGQTEDSGGTGGAAVNDAADTDATAEDAPVDTASESDAADADPQLDAKCTPLFTLQLEDTSAKGQLFTDAIPDPEAFVQDVGRRVCRILYRQPDEVRDANHITLIIRDDPDYAGWKSGDVGDITVMISTSHLADITAGGGDVAEEIEGILLHEMTHMYQQDDKAPGEGTYARMANVIEGVADFVRIRAGSPPPGAVPSKAGEWDDEGYWKPAFFLLWIDVRNPDFLYRLNLSMKPGDGIAWTPDTITDIAGETVDGLWAQYQLAACCSGSAQTCCR